MTQTVDISCFLDVNCNNESLKKEVSIAFLNAFNSKGFVSIIGHGIKDSIINSAFKTCRDFFNCPEETKIFACSKDRARRGYSPTFSENLGSLLGINVPNDDVEKFRMGPLVSDNEKELDHTYYDTKEGRLFFFPNTWTGTLPSLQSVLVIYYKEMEKLSIIILEILELSLKLPEFYFKKKMDKHTSILNVNNYHAPIDKGQRNDKVKVTRVAVAAHMDLSMISITAQTPYQVVSSGQDSSNPETIGYFSNRPSHTIDGIAIYDNDVDDDFDEDDVMTNDEIVTGGGLEVYDDAIQNWTPIPYIPDALIINIGDCLSHWSGGMLKSTLHRVVLNNNDGTNTNDDGIIGNVTPLEEGEVSQPIAKANESLPLPLEEESLVSTQRTTTPHENAGDCSRGGRCSLVYFVSPNHDALLDWPIPVLPSPSLVPLEAITAIEPVKYSSWRKNRIKTVKPPLNPKKM